MKSPLFHLPRFGFAPDSMGWSFFGNPSGLGEGRSIRGSGRFHIIFHVPKRLLLSGRQDNKASHQHIILLIP